VIVAPPPLPRPVPQVVPRPQVSPASALGVPREAEVGGLVPAVARCGHRLDDALEVPLHPLGLALELGAVGVREAGPRLRLELVAGEVLGREVEGGSEVDVEIGGPLTRDAVDEIERDVVESGITEKVHGAPDDLGRRATLEHPEQIRPEALRAERDPGHTGCTKHRGHLARHRLRVRLDRELVRTRQRAQQLRERRTGCERRGPAAQVDALEP